MEQVSLNKSLKVITLRQAAEVKEKARVCTILSNKGGVGKTSIAIALADQCADSGLSTLLLELDSSPGDLSIIFDLENTYNLLDALFSPKDYQEALVPIRKNFQVLLGPSSPLAAEKIEKEAMFKLLSLLKKDFDAVVVDTHPLLTGLILDALEASDAILMVATPEIGAAGRVAFLIDFLTRSASLSKDKFRLLVNMKKLRDNLKLSELLKVVDLPLLSVVKYDRRYSRKINTFKYGHLPKSAISRAMKEVLKEIYQR